MSVVSRDDVSKDLDCSGNFGAILLKLDIVQEKVENIPTARVMAVRTDLVLRTVVLVCVGWRTVWLESGCST